MSGLRYGAKVDTNREGEVDGSLCGRTAYYRQYVLLVRRLPEVSSKVMLAGSEEPVLVACAPMGVLKWAVPRHGRKT